MLLCPGGDGALPISERLRAENGYRDANSSSSGMLMPILGARAHRNLFIPLLLAPTWFEEVDLLQGSRFLVVLVAREKCQIIIVCRSLNAFVLLSMSWTLSLVSCLEPLIEVADQADFAVPADASCSFGDGRETVD